MPSVDSHQATGRAEPRKPSSTLPLGTLSLPYQLATVLEQNFPSVFKIEKGFSDGCWSLVAFVRLPAEFFFLFLLGCFGRILQSTARRSPEQRLCTACNQSDGEIRFFFSGQGRCAVYKRIMSFMKTWSGFFWRKVIYWGSIGGASSSLLKLTGQL